MSTMERNTMLTQIKQTYNRRKEEARQLQISGDLGNYVKALIEVEKIEELLSDRLSRKIA